MHPLPHPAALYDHFTRFAQFACAALVLGLWLAGSAWAQTPTPTATPNTDTSPPTFTITTPAAGYISSETSIIFTGNVSDDNEVDRVMYHADGQTWRKATLNFSGTTSASATWAFTARLRPKHRTTRFHIRAYDATGNESDTIARPVKQK